MAEEIFTYRQAWLPTAPPREQTFKQNEAERHFDWYLEQIKRWNVELSPIKRTMRTLKDEQEHDYLVIYDQRVKVTGSEETIQQLKELVK